MEQHPSFEGEPPAAAEAPWVDQRIHEVVNTALGPLQNSLNAVLQHLNSRENEVPPRTPAEEPPAQPVNPTFLSNRKPLPNPGKFSGKRGEYPSWSQLMRDKIAIDRDFFPSNQAIWYLINSCLDTAPQQVVATFYASRGPDCNYNPDTFLSFLDRSYLDHNIADRATAQLRNLIQREDQSFNHFLPRFERLVAEAGGATWEDKVKIAFLEGALNKQLRQSLVAVQLPRAYNEYLTVIQDVSWKLERLNGPNASRFKRNRGAPVPKLRDAEGDTPMGGINQLAHPQRRRNEQGAPKKETRTCWNCGKVGHIAFRCPQKKSPQINSAGPLSDSEDEFDLAPEEQLAGNE